MKRNNLRARLLSGLLAAAMLLCLCPTAAAADGDVAIGSLSELERFAANCASDAYSRGLTVRLTADIDAVGSAVSVPIFLGHFDGQGHTISGLSLTDGCTGYGLFARVEAGAVVENLTILADVTPAGEQSRVGGIAGENAGEIKNCRFSGVVVAGSAVGGIAGDNSGTITGCSASGAVRGTQYTGGIAGKNSGTIVRCENSASVNTTVSDGVAIEPDAIESTLYNILKDEDVTETAVTTDTGGIAGFSTGAISGCSNAGTVGYPHVGYNVGGIAGRQNGYLAACTNRGEILGRKDVGGIVGQMAPDITLQFSESGLDALQSELDTLQGLIDRTIDDAEETSDTVSGRVGRISDYADRARSSANDLTGQLGDFVDSNVDEVNGLMLLVDRYIEKAAPIADDLAVSASALSDCLAESRTLTDQLRGELVYTDQALSQLQTVCSESEAACRAMLRGIDDMEKALALLGDLEDDYPDTTALRADTQALLTALTALNETIQTAMDEYESTGTVSAATQEQLKSDFRAALTCWSAVLDDLNEIVQNTDLDALLGQTEETLRQVLALLEAAGDEFYDAAEHLAAAMRAAQDALGTLRKLNSDADAILAQLDTALAAAEQSAGSLSSAMSAAAGWARDLAAEDPGSFSALGQSFDDSSDALNTALTGLGGELDALNSELSGASTTLLADVRAVNSQFMTVMNQFLNILSDTQNVDYTGVFEDVSEERLLSATRGKVLECTNYGAVQADRSVGGIAGSMAVENDTDPEDDLLSGENRSSRFTYQAMAIVMDCENFGAVQAKKSCAGDIVGRMDLGTVSGCGGWGAVSSESGDYVGGVAGLSLSSVRGSFAKCTLSGGSYVGGIAGSGARITDCVSMVAVADCTQFGGAVAGEITDEYSGNRFVSDDLAGVDRVSLSGKAEQIGYDALCAIEGIPDEFLHMTLRFLADDRVLRSVEFDYGDSFGSDAYPAAPERDGCYIRWDRTDLRDLRFDTDVTAVYEPYVTTLTADEDESGRPALLVEGLFRAGDALSVSSSAADAGTPDGASDVWTLGIPDDGLDAHTVRYRLPDGGSYTVYAVDERGYHALSSDVVGSYLRFDLPAGAGFAVAPTKHASRLLWALSAAALAAVCAAALLLRRRKKRRARAK